ncbi:MAG: hypothetical protein KDK76_00860 [Chlamydiia bacterium]|nr:hypothetical protein [Chlamydiia bacterium]
MELISGVLNSKSYFTKASAALCGIASIEMTVRTVIDLTKLSNTRTRDEVKAELSADLAGAIFYGILATNYIPGFARGGGMIFVGYSLYSIDDPTTYWSAKVVSYPFKGLRWLIRNFTLPDHPTWYGVAILIASIAVYSALKNRPNPRPTLKLIHQ